MKNDLLHALSVIDSYGLTVIKQKRAYTASIDNDKVRAVIRGNTFHTGPGTGHRHPPKVKARIRKIAKAHPDWTYPEIAAKVGGNIHIATVGRIVRAG